MFDTATSISNKLLIKLIKQRGYRVFCLIAQAQNNPDRITCVTSFSHVWLHPAEQQLCLEFLYSHLKCLFMMSQICIHRSQTDTCCLSPSTYCIFITPQHKGKLSLQYINSVYLCFWNEMNDVNCCLLFVGFPLVSPPV